jgi:ectoine hydroxylase-related dioxygenase (phytanoyl-CoA dioxygenase family)
MALAPVAPRDRDDATLRHAAGDLSGSLTFCVGDDAVTYRAAGGTVTVDEGARDGDTVVRLDPQAWSDLTGQLRTAINLLLSEQLSFERGSFAQLSDWDQVLTYLHAGVPPYHPDRADLKGRDPRASMTLADSDEDLRAQLEAMGYLHLRGVFSAEEMAAANAEVDRLAAQAQQGDDTSWWVTAEDGTDRLCRLVYATQRSAALQALERDPRLHRLGTLLDPTLRIAPDRMEGSAVLIKVPGKTQGLSNIPWHQDCGMGGHAVFCPSVSIGIQLTGSSKESGNLLVVPGSQGQSLHVQWREKLDDVPVVEIDTAPGDVTVHVQDVMHASPRPTGAGGRRTMYTTYYPPTLWEHIGPGEAYNDLVRNRTQQVARLG